ncbi:MAG: bifunctional oligoribonuclease/PAP phosphatase NrnA [Deltaproteobacteria bacterium]|nr:bifunctional oligoribonuclease/PAP phosphatase NrnA [Deltaproteobacteria bacterium]
MSTMTTPPEALIRRLRQGKRFLLTSHINPDGDAVGSSLALARVLRSMGKGAVVWLRDPFPTVYAPLPGASRIRHGMEAPEGYPDKFDTVIPLECPSLDRSGLQEILGDHPNLLNIDHHLGNQLYGAINWVDPGAPSVGELVQRLAETLNVPLDADTANLLYLTLVTDTGGFRFSNATAIAFSAAAKLVEAGARPELISQWLYESLPAAHIQLLGAMLQTLELHSEGRIATASLTPQMYLDAGAKDGDAEGLIDTPRSIAGVEAVALFKVRDDNTVKASLRSQGKIDVEAIARHYGGGGHHNAAGCAVNLDLATAQQEIVAALAEQMGT